MDRVDGGFQSGVDVSLRQPLLLGSNKEYNLSSVNAAEFSLRSSKRSVFLARVNAVVTTVVMVYRVVQQREVVSLNELSVARLASLVQATKAMFFGENGNIDLHWIRYLQRTRLLGIRWMICVFN